MNEPRNQPQAPVPAASFWRSIRMVIWAFLGIRKNSEVQEDTRVNPFHVIVVGIAGAIIFVIGLIILVNWVVAK
ncbi:MAG: DUF2970 domain-containing protein [Pseudomonadota bacterium]